MLDFRWRYRSCIAIIEGKIDLKDFKVKAEMDRGRYRGGGGREGGMGWDGGKEGRKRVQR